MDLKIIKLIDNKKYNKELTKLFDDNFELPTFGLYLFEITASTKSWWQNTASRRVFLNKDSLALKINSYDPLPAAKKKKLLADDLWNGNILKGNELTVYAISRLPQGKTSLAFIAHGKPFLKEVSLYRLENATVSLRNIVCSSRDRLPWVIFLLDNLSASSLVITAKAEKRSGEDDDIKILLDGQIQRNENSKAHHDWLWCGKILKGGTQTFSKKYAGTDSPSRIDLIGDGTPTLTAFELKIAPLPQKKLPLFTLNDVRPYTYKGISGKENYNRFDKDFVDAANQWNKEFDDEFPPPEPLHPNLIKAMVYVESGMGYSTTGSNQAYPDVMQVADANNPASHTLNKDGWRDPHTKKVAEEHEWRKGTIDFVDYKGVANGSTPRESIVWGTRWLYHCAQGVTYQKTRYWRTWHEAVARYNGGGNAHYEEQVYDVFLRGLDKRKGALRIFVIAFIVLLIAGGTGAYAHEKNGDVWLSFDPTNEKGAEYVLTLNEVQGVFPKKTPIAVRYENGGNLYDIRKDDHVDFYSIDLHHNLGNELVVEGVSKYRKTVYVLQKEKGTWTIIPNIDESGILGTPAFIGHDVSFIDTDGKGSLEAKASYYLNYSNAPDEVWHSWYRYDPLVKAFVFFEKNKDPVPEGSDFEAAVTYDRKKSISVPPERYYDNQ